MMLYRRVGGVEGLIFVKYKRRIARVEPASARITFRRHPALSRHSRTTPRRPSCQIQNSPSGSRSTAFIPVALFFFFFGMHISRLRSPCAQHARVRPDPPDSHIFGYG